MSESAVRSAKRPYAFGLLLVVAALLAGPGIVRRLFSVPHALVGKRAPDFALSVVYNGDPGGRLRLSSLEGRPVLLDFWATWCGPCQMEAPVLDRVARAHRDDLIVIGVNTSDEPGLAAAFARKKDLSYPIVYDDGSRVADSYGVEGLPTLVVVNGSGNVVAVQSGVESERDIDQLLAKAR